MKQQRNYVHYKRHKKVMGDESKADKMQRQALHKDLRVATDILLAVIRVKESRNTPPQVQKILNEMGLKEVNNCAFVKASDSNMKKLMLICDYVGYGQPLKTLVDEIIRKRGYLKTADHKRVPISDNVLIEELLGEKGLICVEDVIDALWQCKKSNEAYEAVKSALWPIQLAPLQELIQEMNTKHEATERELKKRNTKASKGGYLGMMGPEINEFIKKLFHKMVKSLTF